MLHLFLLYLFRLQNSLCRKGAIKEKLLQKNKQKGHLPAPLKGAFNPPTPFIRGFYIPLAPFKGGMKRGMEREFIEQ